MASTGNSPLKFSGKVSLPAPSIQPEPGKIGKCLQASAEQAVQDGGKKIDLGLIWQWLIPREKPRVETWLAVVKRYCLSFQAIHGLSTADSTVGRMWRCLVVLQLEMFGQASQGMRLVGEFHQRGIGVFDMVM